MNRYTWKKCGLLVVPLLLALTSPLQAEGESPTAQESVTPASLDGNEISYDMNTGVAQASGNVSLTQGDFHATGQSAHYDTKTQTGSLTGNVTVDRGTLHATAASLTSNGADSFVATGGVRAQDGNLQLEAREVRMEGQGHYIATGSVQAQRGTDSFQGAVADYYETDGGHVLLAQGGTITTQDGTFTANRMEGWLEANRFQGDGAAHIVSPTRNFEGGGEHALYDGKDASGKPKCVLEGDAWAVQGNNTLKGRHLTVYLDDKPQVNQDSTDNAEG